MGTIGLFAGAFIVKSTMLVYISLAVIPVGVIGSYKSLLQSWNRFRAFGRVSAILSLSVPIFAIAYYFVTGGLPGDTYIATMRMLRGKGQLQENVRKRRVQG